MFRTRIGELRAELADGHLGNAGRGRSGFTLIELLVVLAILALLLSIAVPRYVDRVERAKETTLKTSLKVMREAIDKFEGDQGRLPKDLEELVAKRYLKEIPSDPMTERKDSWVVLSALETAAKIDDPVAAPGVNADPTAGGIADVKSGAEGNGLDGSAYREW